MSEHKFTVKIGDDCISCGACEQQCPVAAISQGDTQYNIDPEICTRCSSCISVCPVSAIGSIPNEPKK
jgi:ferredoxin